MPFSPTARSPPCQQENATPGISPPREGREPRRKHPGSPGTFRPRGWDSPRSSVGRRRAGSKKLQTMAWKPRGFSAHRRSDLGEEKVTGSKREQGNSRNHTRTHTAGPYQQRAPWAPQSLPACQIHSCFPSPRQAASTSCRQAARAQGSLTRDPLSKGVGEKARERCQDLQ